jgi:hypothetical protein
MMARGSRSIPAYTSSLYLPGSIGRYRQYPRVVRTPIPGANVKAGKMIWGEQVLNLWGAPVARYSNNNVPLLGLGQMTWPSTTAIVGGLVFALIVSAVMWPSKKQWKRDWTKERRW